MRPRRPAPAAPRLARRAPQGGRAGRAGGAGALPALLARHRSTELRCAKLSYRCRLWRFPWPCGSPSSCRAASPATGPSSSTRSARAARSSGSVRGPTASPSTSARMPPRSARWPERRARRARPTSGCGRPSARARSSGTTCSTRPASRPTRRCRRSWDLVWAGEVTNDAWTPLRAGRRNGVPKQERRPRRFSRSRSAGPDRHAGPLVADRAALRDAARAAGARRAAARAARDRHPRRRSCRGHPGRLRRRLRRAARSRDARALPPRLLRRGARRGAVRARRCGRAAPRAPRAGGGAGRVRRRRRRPGPALRRGAAVAEACGRAGGARRRRARGADRRRGCSLRRARRPLARAAAGSRRVVAAAGARRARRVRAGRRREAARGRALRRRAGDRERASCRSSSRPASSPGRAAPSCVRDASEVPEGDTLHRAAARLQPLVGERLEVETPHPRAQAAIAAEQLDGRRLESVTAVGKNLVLRFEGGVVLRSHLRMSGRWIGSPARDRRQRSAVARAARVDSSRGSSGAGRCSSCTRAPSRGSGPTSSPARPTSTRCSRACAAPTATRPLGRDAPGPDARRRHREHVGGRDALGRPGSRRGCGWARCPEDDRRRVLETAASADARLRRRRPRAAAAGVQPRRPAVPALPHADPRVRARATSNRTAYWCPACQPGDVR